MAIDTNNKKLALMVLGRVWESSTPLSPSTLGADDQQQLLWGYPGVLWEAGTIDTGEESALFAVRIFSDGG